MTSIAAKIGCTAQSLNEWVKKAEILVEGDDGIALVDATELKSPLNRLADAPGAVTGVFEDFG